MARDWTTEHYKEMTMENKPEMPNEIWLWKTSYGSVAVSCQQSPDLNSEYHETHTRYIKTPAERDGVDVEALKSEVMNNLQNMTAAEALEELAPWLDKYRTGPLFKDDKGRVLILEEHLKHFLSLLENALQSQATGKATSMQRLEVGKDQYGDPLCVMGTPNAINPLKAEIKRKQKEK